jgi:hypothetical protein
VRLGDTALTSRIVAAGGGGGGSVCSNGGTGGGDSGGDGGPPSCNCPPNGAAKAGQGGSAINDYPNGKSAPATLTCGSCGGGGGGMFGGNYGWPGGGGGGSGFVHSTGTVVTRMSGVNSGHGLVYLDIAPLAPTAAPTYALNAPTPAPFILTLPPSPAPSATPTAPTVAPTTSPTVTSCATCTAGTYCLSRVGCQPCPSGTYKAAPGGTPASSCLPCPSGTVSKAGSTSCDLCPAGTNSSAVAAPSPTLCCMTAPYGICVLACPPGYPDCRVTSVVFASFGQPTGRYWCHG